MDVHTLTTTTANFKSKLMEWAQRAGQRPALRHQRRGPAGRRDGIYGHRAAQTTK
ncbi:MAG: hypothetical protein WKG07_01860 [Hymenobacter sp.]